MLQRIQTVYMILAILAMAALYLWFPTVQDSEGVLVITKNEPMVYVPLFGAIVLTVLAIINYKKRQLQFVLNRLGIILNFFLLGVFVYRALSIPGETLVSEKGIGVLIPVVSIVLLVLANRAIRRDENLVKSADRLR